MKKLPGRIVFAVLCLWLLPQSVFAAQLLVPVGQVVGLELGGNTVTVAAFDDVLGAQAREAGLRVGDEIVKIDDRAIASAEDIHQALIHSDGTVELEVQRDGALVSVNMAPEITQDGPRLGVYLRQGVTGIGTVTFYDPETGRFGTLGHGVNDAKGNLVQMQTGSAYRATVASVKKGRAGSPGQLRGAVADALGSLYGNTVQGVFGTTDSGWLGEAIPVAAVEEITAGPAVIRSTVSGDQVREYSVEILKIYPDSKEDGRNLLLKVTDEDLLEVTGGIVQGMGVSYNRDNTGTLKSLQGLGDSPGFSLTKINPCTCAGTQGRTSFVSSDQAIRMKYIERRFSKPSILFKQPYIILPHRIRHRAVSVTLFGAFLFDMITDWRKI